MLENAIERAREQRVRVNQRIYRQYYVSTGRQTRERYQLRLQGGRWTCTCPAGEHNKTCKHVGALARRAKREGWEFEPALQIECDL